MQELQRRGDMALDTYRNSEEALWGEFARTYAEWSLHQKDDYGNFRLGEVLWQRYVAARDVYLCRPRRLYD